MTYRRRISLFIIIDSSIVLTAIFISWFLIQADIHMQTLPFIITTGVFFLCHHLFAIGFKLYKKVWEYASIGELFIIVKVVAYSIFIALIIQLVMMQEIYIRFLVAILFVHIVLIGGSRFIWRIYRDLFMSKQDNQLRTLIIGAGSAGTMVARQLLNNNDTTLLPVAFIDDDENKHQLHILGLPVIGGADEIVRAVEELKIDHIVIALPSPPKKQLNKIIQECAKTKVKTKIIPQLEDIVTGKVSVSQFRDVEVEDFLARDPIHI